MELKVVIHAIYGTQKIRLICLDQLYIPIIKKKKKKTIYYINHSLKNWTDLANPT